MFLFWRALFFVALAEMGDKTQLVTLAFATRFRARIVLVAIFVATLAVHLFSVALGETIGSLFPEQWIAAGAGVAFLGFGIWTLRGDTFEEEGIGKPSRFGPFLTVAITFFIAELGDKTMLTTVILASRSHSFVPVWIGSTVGMVIADGLAVALGVYVGRQLPERPVKVAAAAVFIVTGLVTLWSALS